MYFSYEGERDHLYFFRWEFVSLDDQFGFAGAQWVCSRLHMPDLGATREEASCDVCLSIP